MRNPILSLFLCTLEISVILPTTEPNVHSQQKSGNGAAEPRQRRVLSAVAHPRFTNVPVRQRALAGSKRLRAALITKAGATVGRQSSVPTHVTSIAPPYEGGPSIFTTRVIRRVSSSPFTVSSTTPATPSSTSSLTTSGSTTPLSSSSSTTPLTTSSITTPLTTSLTSTSFSTTTPTLTTSGSATSVPTTSTGSTVGPTTTTTTTPSTTSACECTVQYALACTAIPACTNNCCEPPNYCGSYMGLMVCKAM